MKSNLWIRAAVPAILTIALGIPPRGWTAFAQQDNGPIKPPQQTAPPPPQAPAQPTQDQKQTGQQKPPDYSIAVESNLVRLEAVATDQDGNILTGLNRTNFRIIDDGAPQQITYFSPSDAPITVVILMEFSRISYWFARDAKVWGYEFLSHLNKKDWVALITYDLKTTLQVDFTQNREEVEQSIVGLFFPDFSEANMFDSVIETVDRMQDVKGKKAILLLASGYDTFSKHTLDQTIKHLRTTDVTIYSVGVAEEAMVRSIRDGGIGYIQAKNQLTTFSKMTGGYAWFPRFDGELPGIFDGVTAYLRNQVTLGFTPTNPARDGKYHKLKVEAVDNNGNPLTVPNAKGKPRKVIVYCREGYTAPTGTVGD
jgi:VWFA-related protein